MESQNGLIKAHLVSEVQNAVGTVVARGNNPVIIIDTLGRRIRVEWDPAASAIPMGQLVYFAQFLATAGLFFDWVKHCRLH